MRDLDITYLECYQGLHTVHPSLNLLNSVHVNWGVIQLSAIEVTKVVFYGPFQVNICIDFRIFHSQGVFIMWRSLVPGYRRGYQTSEQLSLLSGLEPKFTDYGSHACSAVSRCPQHVKMYVFSPFYKCLYRINKLWRIPGETLLPWASVCKARTETAEGSKRALWFRGKGWWNVGFGEYSSLFLFACSSAQSFPGPIIFSTWRRSRSKIHRACIFLGAVFTVSSCATVFLYFSSCLKFSQISPDRVA